MKILKSLYWLLIIVVAFVSSCKKEAYTLDALPDKSQIKFEAIQDKSIDPGGNTVILVNKTPGAVAIWDYTTGTSNRDRDTVHYAFKGDYVIRFSAMTAGGVVKADSVVLQVTKDELKYVSDPLWIHLTGGPGNEKTWVLDVNANGDKKAFTSPIYFAGGDNAYGALAEDGKSIIWSQVCEVPNGSNCWIYAPNYTSDTWAADKKDHGYLTFSLKGGPFLTADHKGVAGLGVENGTYFLDVNTKMLTTAGASILGVNFTHGDVGNIYSVRVISLTENTMQLAVKHKSKNEYQVLNYLSKTFSENWVAPPPAAPVIDPGFNPKFASGGLLNFLTDGVSRTWKMDADGNPVDWIKAGKGFTTSYTSTAGWGWDPASWNAALDHSYIKFEKNGLKYTRFQGGTKTTGTFTVDESKNEVTLVGNTLLQNTSSWMNSTQNKLKVVKAFPNDISKGIWFGVSYDTAKDEWYSLHYVLF